MKLFYLYFWVCSKGVTFSKSGDMEPGVIGLVLPIFLVVDLFLYFLSSCFQINIPMALVIFIAVVLDIPVFLFFKKNNKGKKIIKYYDRKKFNKWYYVALLEMFFVFLFFSFLLCGLLFVKLISKS